MCIEMLNIYDGTSSREEMKNKQRRDKQIWRYGLGGHRESEWVCCTLSEEMGTRFAEF